MISKLKSDAGSVVLMTQSLYPLPSSQCRFLNPTDDYRPYVWLNFNLSQLPCLLMVKFFIAYCFLEAAAVGFKGYKNPKSHLCNGFWLEITFRYLLDKTLVVIVAILLPGIDERTQLPFQVNRLVLVVEKLSSGEWKPFFVGGLSFLPVNQENSKGLKSSQEIEPLGDTDAVAIQSVVLATLRSGEKFDDSQVLWLPPKAALPKRTAFADNVKGGRFTITSPSKVSGFTILRATCTRRTHVPQNRGPPLIKAANARARKTAGARVPSNKPRRRLKQSSVRSALIQSHLRKCTSRSKRRLAKESGGTVNSQAHSHPACSMNSNNQRSA